MTCYSPLHAFKDGVTKDGKTHYKITSNKVKSVYFDSATNHWYLSEDPYRYYNNDYIDVPCGKCVDYRDWETDRKSTRLNSSHSAKSRMPSSA